MHFSHLQQGSSKASKFALIVGIHVVLGTLLVRGIQTKTLIFPEPPPEVTIAPLPPETVPPPPEPPKPRADLPPPTVVVPIVETPVTPPPDANVIHGTEPDRAPPQTVAGPAEPAVNPPADPPAPPAKPARMHTAVLADANACALPAYPARAARNGDSGTTVLALLVGIDGRVSSSRVERSSGSRELDRAAVDALSLCKFKPATSNGVPEAGWAQIGYEWRLD